MDDLPFSQAAENNQAPILAQLSELLEDCQSVLEIGAGTGQHAAAFAAALPHLRWQPTEQPQALDYLIPRCTAAGLSNLQVPLALDIAKRPWMLDWPDAVYSANTLHIVAKPLVESLFCACGEQGKTGSLLVVYGPFNYDGDYTSPSNADFDIWLKDRDRNSGIRDFEWVDALAREAGYDLVRDAAMPANNRLLCWRKVP